MLVKSTDKTRDELMNMMKLSDSPIDWLTTYTNIVSVWSEGYYTPVKLTKEQYNSLKKLIRKGLVKDNLMN